MKPSPPAPLTPSLPHLCVHPDASAPKGKQSSARRIWLTCLPPETTSVNVLRLNGQIALSLASRSPACSSGIHPSPYFSQSAHWLLTSSVNISCVVWRILASDKTWLMTPLSSQSVHGCPLGHKYLRRFRLICIQQVKLFKTLALNFPLTTLPPFYRGGKLSLGTGTCFAQGHTGLMSKPGLAHRSPVFTAIFG